MHRYQLRLPMELYRKLKVEAIVAGYDDSANYIRDLLVEHFAQLDAKRVKKK